MLWLLWFRKIEWGKYVLTLLRKMKQSTIFKLTFWTVMFLLWINVDLLYCYDMSLENFTESTFFYIFSPRLRQIYFLGLWKLLLFWALKFLVGSFDSLWQSRAQCWPWLWAACFVGDSEPRKYRITRPDLFIPVSSAKRLETHAEMLIAVAQRRIRTLHKYCLVNLLSICFKQYNNLEVEGAATSSYVRLGR